MIKIVDDFLNGITMYRLILYVLICLVFSSVVLSFFKLIPFNPLSIIISALSLTLVCWLSNKIFSKLLKVPTNLESLYITALILVLIATPASTLQGYLTIFGIGVLAMASKYFLAIYRKHIFNPAAFSVVISGIYFNYPASWWVANAWMVVFVLIGGLLVVRKIRRFNMVISFLLAVEFITSVLGFVKGNNVLLLIQNSLLKSPILFLAFIMLTEPLTTPPKRIFQILYGGLVGLLYTLPFNVGSVYNSPELALVLSNIFSYLVSPKERLLLELKDKIKLNPDIYDFLFKSDKKLNFLPGQYLEWTLSHPKPDSRGTRRYFTIASSPVEENLTIGVKFYPQGSSFKKALLGFKKGGQLLAGQLSGEFTLPKDLNQKLVFIAGGIGVTPYRSMVKYLLDTGEKRDIVLLYSSKREADFVYKDIFEKAVKNLGIKVVYILTSKDEVPENWKGGVGYIDEKLIKKEVPDFKQRIFYLSGPHSMVDAFEKTLKEMIIPANQIKVDFFPGYT